MGTSSCKHLSANCQSPGISPARDIKDSRAVLNSLAALFASLWRSPLMNIGTRRHAVSLVGVLRLKLLVR
jgi:hypothetical protein